MVNELLPSVNYEYQCGYIHILDDEEPDLSNLFWILVKIHQFRTKYKDDAITFAFGSIFDSRGDNVCASMAPKGLDQVLMSDD